MTHLNLLLFDAHLDLCRQFEQTQVVGYCGAFLAHALRHALLRQVVFVHQTLVCQRDLDGIQILTLDVLNESPFHHLLVLGGADICRDTLQTGYLTRAETTLTGDDHIGAIAVVTQRDRRYHTVLANRVR